MVQVFAYKFLLQSFYVTKSQHFVILWALYRVFQDRLLGYNCLEIEALQILPPLIIAVARKYDLQRL